MRLRTSRSLLAAFPSINEWITAGMPVSEIAQQLHRQMKHHSLNGLKTRIYEIIHLLPPEDYDQRLRSVRELRILEKLRKIDIQISREEERFQCFRAVCEASKSDDGPRFALGGLALCKTVEKIIRLQEARESLLRAVVDPSVKLCKRQNRGDARAVNPTGERFRRHLVESPDGCLLWTGPRSREAYPILYVGQGTKKLTHRYVYEELRGPIPRGGEIDRACGNTLCVNHEHLELITPEEVRMRRREIGRANFAASRCSRVMMYQTS